MSKKLLVASALLASSVASTTSVASAQESFKNKRISIVCGCSAGGVYDAFSRIMAQYLPQYVPGNPTVIVQNMPGAGGAVSANYVYTVAPKDGTVLGVPLSSVVLAQVLRPKSVKYDVTKLGWIGVATPLTEVISVLDTAPAKTIEDAKKTQLVMGATSKNSQSYMEPAIAAALLGLKFRITTGYKGGTQITLAMEQGEVHGKAQAWTTWQVQRPAWVKEGRLIHLMQIGTKDPKLEGVPALVDLVKTDRERAMARVINISSDTGLALYSPPNVPRERLTVLRNAFTQAMTNADLISVMDKQINQTVAARSGESFQSYVNEAVSTAQDVVDAVNKAIE